MRLYMTRHSGAWRKPYNDHVREAAARADLHRLAREASRFALMSDIEREALVLLGRWRRGFVSPVAMVELINDFFTLRDTDEVFELDDHTGAIRALRNECAGRQAAVRHLGLANVSTLRAYIGVDEPSPSRWQVHQRVTARLALATCAASLWCQPRWHIGALDAVRLAALASVHGEAIFYETARDRLQVSVRQADRRRRLALTKHWRAVKVQATGASAAFTLAALPSYTRSWP